MGTAQQTRVEAHQLRLSNPPNLDDAQCGGQKLARVGANKELIPLLKAEV